MLCDMDPMAHTSIRNKSATEKINGVVGCLLECGERARFFVLKKAHSRFLYLCVCLFVCLSIFSSMSLLTWRPVSPWTEWQTKKKKERQKNDQQAVSIMGWAGSAFLFFVPDVKRWSAHTRTLPLSLLLFFVMHDRHEDDLHQFVIAIVNVLYLHPPYQRLSFFL